MINWEQFIEYATSDHTYSWFIFDNKFLPFLTEEEKSIVYIDELDNGKYCRMFYPKEKYLASNEFKAVQELKARLSISPEDRLKEKIRKAAMKCDFATVILLKAELAELKGQQ